MMSLRFYYFIALFFFPIKCSPSVNILNTASETSTKPIQNIATNFSDFIDVAAENGYKAEKHEVTTEDGYILTMHRIPPGTNCTKKTPILGIHGLLQASEGFIDAGPDSPAIALAKECYDVWFGNVRGNNHSRMHVRLDPDKDKEFWKFSIDQIGLYDIPAMIDHVLNTTNSKKLIYIGYSQGGGTFFIMNSEIPEYSSKISLFVGLAPATRHLNAKSAIFRLTKAANDLRVPLEAAGVWKIQSEGFPLQGLASSLCQVELLAATECGLLAAALEKPHPGSVTPDTVKRLYQHVSGGTSIQNLAHYGQLTENEKFTKFNYGAKENMKVYGSAYPPEYELEAVNVPAVIYHGLADQVVDTKDLDWTVRKLPNVLAYIKLEDPLWNHVDMTYSQYWKDTIYVTMKKYLSKYDSCY